MIPLLKDGEGESPSRSSAVLTTLEELLTRSLPTLKLEPASLELKREREKKSVCVGAFVA